MRHWLRHGPLGVMVRRVVVGVVGGVLIVTGIILLAFPGPGMVVALFGVGVLSTEFPWFARLRRRIEALARRLFDGARAWWQRRGRSGPEAAGERPAGEMPAGRSSARRFAVGGAGRSRDETA